jgi:hypothetical protein
MTDDVKVVIMNEWTKTIQQKDGSFVTQPKCDVFELECRIGSNITYRYLYSHINEK